MIPNVFAFCFLHSRCMYSCARLALGVYSFLGTWHHTTQGVLVWVTVPNYYTSKYPRTHSLTVHQSVGHGRLCIPPAVFPRLLWQAALTAISLKTVKWLVLETWLVTLELLSGARGPHEQSNISALSHANLPLKTAHTKHTIKTFYLS